MTHPIRFGLAGGSSLRSADEIRSVALSAEAAGFSSFTANDHLASHLAPLPVLAAVAVLTERIKLAPLVLANDFRHPVMLAKEVATIDVISGGRFELGVGAGWADDDYGTLGIPKQAASARIERLREAVEIVIQSWASEPLSYTGRHYRVAGPCATPSPANAAIPLCIGGGGTKILSYAATVADIVGINLNFATGRQDRQTTRSGHQDLVRSRIDLVRETASSVGRSPELQCRVQLASIGENTSALRSALSQHAGFSADELDASPYNLIGTPTQVIEKITRWAGLGLTYWIIPHEAMSDFAPIVAQLSGTIV